MKKIGVIGLGYVGLGLATALSKKHTVLCCDISQTRIDELQKNFALSSKLYKIYP